MLADLLPRLVVAVEATDRISPGPLLPEEASLLGNAVPKRRVEFTVGRHCAREALALLGVPVQPILIGQAREPLWPAGIVGSITHCTGFCAAAVARQSDVASIGIDAEPHEALPTDVLSSVAREDECRALGALPSVGVHWDRVLFSAKESVYKAWYPLAARWLGFKDVRLAIQPDFTNPADGKFTALLLGQTLEVDGQPVALLEGRYRAEDGRVLTAVVVGLAISGRQAL
jgi:4'-phosphopantetheinyl transferase EntD